MESRKRGRIRGRVRGEKRREMRGKRKNEGIGRQPMDAIKGE